MHKSFVVLSFFSLILFSGCGTNNGAIGSNLTPQSQVKNLLNNGANSAFSIFGNPNDFLTNALIEAVLPQGLKDINAKLKQLGLNSIIEKENAIIGSVAKTSVDFMKPLIVNTIQNLTAADAIAIISGGKGAATKYLRNKTEAQLIKSLTPVVSAELNKLGATKLINSALGRNGGLLDAIIGGFLGSNTSGSTSNKLESLVTTQLIDGLYNVVLDSEKKTSLLQNGINSIFSGN